MQEEPLGFKDASDSCFKKSLPYHRPQPHKQLALQSRQRAAVLQKEEVQLNDIILQEIIAKAGWLRWLEQEQSCVGKLKTSV